MKARDLLIALWKKNNKNWTAIYKDLMNKNMDDIKKFIKKEDDDKYITILDADYPADLKTQYQPPFVIERE